MRLKQKLPVSYLLFTTSGRINRGTYWKAAIFYWSTFYILFNLLLFVTGWGGTWLLYPVLFWVIAATSIKRLHDQNLSGYWLLAVLVPVFGPVFLLFCLGFRKGNHLANFYGTVPGAAADYLKNDEGLPSSANGYIINDVTKLNPVLVNKIVKPASVEELCHVVKNTSGAVSVGGGRFSMG
ncbi:MAG: DUF805 domain-containing protein, partial [Sphingobacteriales bacterium]